MPELSTSPEIDAFLGVTRDLMGVALRSIAPEGLTAPQFRLLFVLRENGTTSSAQAARMLDLVPSSVTRMAVRLVTAGLVQRTGIPEHRGVVALSLTKEGDAVVSRVTARRRDELTGILDRLSPETRRAATEAMTAIHDLLRGEEHIGGVVL